MKCIRPTAARRLSIVAPVSLLSLAVAAASPALGDVATCEYRVYASANPVGQIPVPGGFLRVRGRFIDYNPTADWLRGTFSSDKVRAQVLAAQHAHRCLTAAATSRTMPANCRPGHRRNSLYSRRNYAQIIAWNVNDLNAAAFTALCAQARRFNKIQVTGIKLVVVRTRGGQYCDLRGRYSRVTLYAYARPWSCGSGRPVPPRQPVPGAGRPVPRQAVPDAVRNCPSTHQPVCASVGGGQIRTYSNDCLARRANARIVYNGACQNTRSGRANRSGRPLPPQNRVPCSRRYKPVCAHTRAGYRTFVNACRARQYRGRIVHFGRCRRR